MDYNSLREQTIFPAILDLSEDLSNEGIFISLKKYVHLIKDSYDEKPSGGRAKKVIENAPKFQSSIQVKYKDNSEQTIVFGVVSNNKIEFRKIGTLTKRATIGNKNSQKISINDVTDISIQKIVRDMI